MAQSSITRVQTGTRGAQVALESRTRIERNDSNLFSVEGAQQIISMIEGRRSVSTLHLSHNMLGDDGCVALFKFLCSSRGRLHPISEIQLGDNRIGNALLAVAEYLTDNIHLRTLDLPNNALISGSNVGAAFALAINSSRLESLNLSANNGLSDAFISSFLPSLNSRFLRTLRLSATGLTPDSIPYIVKYLSSDTCSLDSFVCNANDLGHAGVRAIYNALSTCDNCRLTQISVFANEEADQGAQDEAKRVQNLLKLLVARNLYYNKRAQADALRLLRYSRPLLLHSEDTPKEPSPKNNAPCSDSCSCFPTPADSPNPSSSRSLESPFSRLPTEMKHYILSFFAPSLSAAQTIRVFHYASSASTLPQLLACLPSSNSSRSNHSICVPDPSNLIFGDTNKIWKIGGGGVGAGGGCAAGKCLGSNSLLCHREQDSKAWLTFIGCDVYEKDSAALINS